MSKLTIFSCPKPFNGHIETIQRNAVQSWTHLSPKPQVILMGNEKGVGEAAREYGAHHIELVKRNAHGTPLLSSIFEEAYKNAQGDVQVYVNGDIILTSKMVKAVEQLTELKKEFLGVTRRMSIDITKPLDFASDWQKDVEKIVQQNWKLEHYSAIDCFIFPKGMVETFPSFALGRPMWDNWFIYNTQKRGIPVIDLTAVSYVIHQNHDYAHLKGGSWEGPEAEENRTLAGGYTHAHTIADSDYLLTPNGLKKNVRRYYSKFVRNLKTIYHRIQHDAHW
jgi:hypothetical protein